MDTYISLCIHISISIYIKLNQSQDTLVLILAFSYCLSELLSGSAGKESAHNEGDLGLIPGWDTPLEEGTAAHSSILAWRIPMDIRAWKATVHRVTKSGT